MSLTELEKGLENHPPMREVAAECEEPTVAAVVVTGFDESASLTTTSRDLGPESKKKRM